MSYDWEQAARDPIPEPRPPRTWIRVTKHRTCPVCGRPDWCSLSADGEVAMCMRVPDGAVRQIDLGHGIGHVHELAGVVAPRTTWYTPRSPVWDLDCDAVLERWRATTTHEAVEALAGELGVHPEALRRLDAVWAPARKAWAFPMHDDKRGIVGFRLRSAAGGKYALDGSKTGVFIPRGLSTKPQLLICEGPTDTAAALTLGFDAIGRPSCSGAVSIICDMLAVGRRRPVVIVVDRDGPGRSGANRLADRILGLCETVRIITPAPHKDLRQWLQAGASRNAVQLRIDNAAIHAVRRKEEECPKSKPKKS